MNHEAPSCRIASNLACHPCALLARETRASCDALSASSQRCCLFMECVDDEESSCKQEPPNARVSEATELDEALERLESPGTPLHAARATKTPTESVAGVASTQPRVASRHGSPWVHVPGSQISKRTAPRECTRLHVDKGWKALQNTHHTHTHAAKHRHAA